MQPSAKFSRRISKFRSACCLADCLKTLVSHGDLRGAFDAPSTLKMLNKYGRKDRPKSVNNTLGRLAVVHRGASPMLRKVSYGQYTRFNTDGAQCAQYCASY